MKLSLKLLVLLLCVIVLPFNKIPVLEDIYIE